jgi:hypothetical protein
MRGMEIMADRITSENLDDIIKKNISIEDEIRYYISEIYKIYNNTRINSPEKLAFKILNGYNLIQLPIEDEYLGGKVEIRNNKKIPIINTNQPRVYQYFIAWHEVYHILFDKRLDEENIPSDIKIIDVSLNERKADYFAACMILGNVIDYYYELEGSFIDKVMMCMDTYKAPYKVIIIKLYEYAYKNNNESLKNLCLENIDKKPTNLENEFKRLGLDTELVKPSNIINLGNLEKTIVNQIQLNPDTFYHKSNYNYFNEIKNELSKKDGYRE